ncbi:MAG: hypothetical protein FWF72_05760 [Paludibacter sp.]|nr:hypothetical protein [Paludibacter sp.]
MKKILLAICNIIVVFAACTSKQAPSPIGEFVTAEQIQNLPKNDSWNNKLVSFEGYFGFCKMFGRYNAGAKAELKLTTEANCEGKTLINAKIWLEISSSTTIFGSAPRNQIVADKNIDTKTLKVITDDYQKVDYQKFIFSGNLIYAGNSYYLDNVTIHLIK